MKERACEKTEDYNGGLYLYWDGVSNACRQELEHLHVATQQAQCVGAGVDLSVCVFIAEGVNDVHHNGRRERHSVGLSICRLPHFVSFHCTEENNE